MWMAVTASAPVCPVTWANVRNDWDMASACAWVRCMSVRSAERVAPISWYDWRLVR